MQSTLKSVPPAAFRPKIGRPPALPPAPRPELSLIAPEPTPQAAPASHLRKPYLLAGVLIIGALATVIALALPHGLGKLNLTAPPPTAPLIEDTFNVETPEGKLTGRLARLEPASGSAQSPAIDNTDRQRLLSILSKD